MRYRTRKALSGQLRLFPPTAPVRWIDLPVETRQRIVTLLARLLCQRLRAPRAPEVRDE